MGWETYGGKQYYYRKRREGNRVISEYVGRGELAEAIAALDALDKRRQALEREAWKETKRHQRELDAMIDEIGGYVRAMVKAELIAAGYHTHKRQWRKQSDKS